MQKKFMVKINMNEIILTKLTMARLKIIKLTISK